MRALEGHLRRVARFAASVGFIAIGIAHFARPEPFLAIMPPYLPWHLTLVHLSGACEIAGGIGLLHPRTRRAAALGLVALLVAVFPANVHMALHDIQFGGFTTPPWVAWARLPLQLVFIAWVLWCSRPDEPRPP